MTDQSDIVAGMASTVDEHGVVMHRPETETVPEDAEHARLVDLIFAWLSSKFAGDADVAVHERLAWFPDADDTRIRLDPDVMVIRGRPRASRTSYKAWAEDGVAPTVVIEVWSRSDTHDDYRRRLARMSAYGVAEVVLVAPFFPGGCQVTHLVNDGAGGFATRAVSASPKAPLLIDSLGVHLAGGTDFTAYDERGTWTDTTDLALQLIASRDQATQHAAEVHRLTALLEAEGIVPPDA